MKDEWITISEAVKILGVGRSSVRNLIELGYIKHRSLPGCRTRVSKTHAEEIAQTYTSDPRRPFREAVG